MSPCVETCLSLQERWPCFDSRQQLSFFVCFYFSAWDVTSVLQKGGAFLHAFLCPRRTNSLILLVLGQSLGRPEKVSGDLLTEAGGDNQAK